jgi:peroxiredoxin
MPEQNAVQHLSKQHAPIRREGPPRLVAMAAAALLLFACLGQTLTAAPPGHKKHGRNAVKPKVGQQVTDFGFTGLDGRQYRLSDFSGHYVLLDFWATWCSLCLEEEPTLRKAYDRLRSRGLLVIGLDSDKHAAKARKYVDEHHVPWPQSAPQSTKYVLDHVLKVKWYPAMVVLDPQGKIVLVSGNGKRFLRGNKLLRALNRLLPPEPVAGRPSPSSGE